MNSSKIIKRLFIIICAIAIVQGAILISASAPDERHPVKKILFIGDSMTGWLSERLNAYGEKNGFEVSTVVWDGSTISKWANSPQLAKIISESDPDAVFVSLGMNELFEPHPAARLKAKVDKIKEAVGDRPILWVGPPSWPGQNKGSVLNDWLEEELGSDAFFRSFGMNLQRQSAGNPHPSKAGIITWMDSIVRWIPEHAEVKLPGISVPEGPAMSRGKEFVYKRMKDNL